MKRYTSRLFIALLTFIIGVSVGTLEYLYPNFRRAPDKIALPRNQKPSNANLASWQILRTFENQDLRKLDQQSSVRLQKAIDTLVGKNDNELLIPRLISKISNSPGQPRYVLIEESPLLTIPGESGLRIHVFDLEGKLLSSSKFSSGWRILLSEMRVTYKPEIGRDLLEVGSQPVINGRDVAKQYYALIGEKVLVVRLEDSGGRSIPDIYGAPNHTIGLTLTGRSADEWEKALESNDIAEVLATLMWIGGIHWNPRNPSPEYTHEEMSEARLADELHSRESVKVMLKTLLQSENVWIRRAAELAMKVEYY